MREAFVIISNDNQQAELETFSQWYKCQHRPIAGLN
jgi:hypothetical protein